MPATRRDRYTSRPRAAARFVAQRLLMRPTVWSVVKVTVFGRKNLKDLGSTFVLVANHSSHLDAPLIMGGLPWRLAQNLSTGAAADYFFDVWWRRGLTKLFFNAFPIEREGGPKRGVSAKVLVQRGVALLVFPEGTRSHDRGKTLAPFKPGAAAIAQSAEVPVLPVAIIGAGLAHPRGSKWPGPGRLPVGIAFGVPMESRPGESAPDFMDRIRVEIERLRAEHTREVLGSDDPWAAADAAEGAR